jgi:hypothetical protein
MKTWEREHHGAAPYRLAPGWVGTCGWVVAVDMFVPGPEQVRSDG